MGGGLKENQREKGGENGFKATNDASEWAGGKSWVTSVTVGALVLRTAVGQGRMEKNHKKKKFEKKKTIQLDKHKRGRIISHWGEKKGN